METFGTWLNEELRKRDWSMSELARRTAYSHVTISHIISGQRNPSSKLCTKIAKAFRLPVETVFKEAGLFPSVPADEEPVTQELLDLIRALTPEERSQVITYIRFLHSQSG